MNTRPPTLSIAAFGAQLRSGETTIAVGLETARNRIAQFNSRYRAFSYLCEPDRAEIERLQAECAAQKFRGALHGVAASVKGNLPVAGLPWTEGSRLFAGRVAREDAGIVAKLRAAGGVVLGATTLSELAMYGVTNPFEPMGVNPWDPTRTAGGSSTGAGVAAALGMAFVNIGTDSGGSIRNPACHCGVVGLMPGIGVLSPAGKRNYAPSLSSVGLVTRSVADAAAAFGALRETEARAPIGPSRRLLVPRRLIESMCDGETQALFAAALARIAGAGFTLVECDLAGWSAGEAAAGVISLHEGEKALRSMDPALLSEGLRQRAENARRLTADQVSEARHNALGLRRAFEDALAQTGADAFVTPTWPFAAPAIEAETVLVNGRSVPIDPHRNIFVRAANAIDAAALTLPMGLYPTANVPAGLHLMTLRGWEDRLLAAAQLVEAAMPALPPLHILTEDA